MQKKGMSAGRRGGGRKEGNGGGRKRECMVGRKGSVEAGGGRGSGCSRYLRENASDEYPARILGSL